MNESFPGARVKMRSTIHTLTLLIGLLASSEAVGVSFSKSACDSARYIPVERYAWEERILPVVSVKTNILHGLVALAPNLGVEIGLGGRSSLDISGAYRSWGAWEDEEKILSHAILRVEFRAWLSERFYGHFFGIQALYGTYEIGDYDFLSIFQEDARYEGTMLGASLSYGYHLILGRRWGVEFSASGGALLFDYNEFDPSTPGVQVDNHAKLYMGLTGARLSLVFMIK